MLVETASVFQKMLDGPFMEATERAAKFPEDDEEAWEALIEWMYDREEFLHYLPPPGVENLDMPEALMYVKRIKLCCLAEKYGIFDLHNKAIDSVVEVITQESENRPIFHWRIFKACCVYVYDNSSEGSALRRLF